MAYIGKTPVIGNFQICDAITVVDAQAAYTMQVGGVNVSPESANHMLVSLNGILQAPTTSFTVSGSTITFASALETGDVIDFIQILGNVLDLGVPSDATVSTAKIVDGAVTSAKLASGVGGKVLQVVQTVKTDTFSTTSTSAADVTGLSVSITPSSSSSKILVMYDVKASAENLQMSFFLVRDTTTIYIGDAASSRIRASSVVGGVPDTVPSEAYRYPQQMAVTFLDSPSTTSATTYKIQCQVNGGTGYVNRSGADDDAAYRARVPSSITLMEISA